MATVEERLARAKANSPKTYAMLNGTPAPPVNTVSAPVNNSFQVQGNIYTDKNVPKEVQAAASQITKPLTYDMTADINKLTEISQQKRISELAKARDTALSNLNREKSTIQPMYYDKRAQTSTASQLGARNFAEFLASRGQTKAGFSAQAELNRGMTLQNNIGALNRQEQSAFDDIARRTTDTNNDFASDVANASMGIEADKLKMLMDAKEKSKQEYINSITGLGSQMDYQAEINKLTNDGDVSNDWKIPYLQKEREKKIQTNLKTDVDTISRYSNDYQAEILRRQLADLNDPLIPYLQTARQGKLNSIQEAESKSNDALYKHYMDVFKETGIVSNEEMASILGIPKGTYSLDYAKTKYDISKPYYKPSSGGGSGGMTAGEAKDNAYAETFNYLKGKTVPQALQALQNPTVQANMKAKGIDVKTMWNDVVKDAIRLNTPGVFNYDDYYGMK